MDKSYDVVIMGGGPAGSTMAALLRRRSDIKVAIVEQERFPRDHIGESLVHCLIPILEDSGSLSKVLASDCWVKKFGGIYAWEQERPAVAYFDHLNFLQDGVHRWSFHVNRSDFDKILLDHARSMGVDVIEGVSVTHYEPERDDGRIRLSDGRELRARFFVDASGRQTGMTVGGRHQHLSEYRNLAVWNHYLGCRPAQDLAGEWNIYHHTDRSPIACFAFEHGWAWYIPVPKEIDGERHLTYSIGIVTDPAYIKTAEDFTKPDIFLDQVRRIPRLRDLCRDARPVRQEMLVTSNYSMICERFCDYDDRWILVGDAAYFVDPLFSSGVTFAAAMAGAAAVLIKATLDSRLSDRDKRSLWGDYTRDWVGIAQSFALAIDQWYHAISEDNPDSVYWRRRSGHSKALGIRRETFQALVDTAITPDLMQILTHGSHAVSDLSGGGSFVKTLGRLRAVEPAADASVRLAPGTRAVESFTVEVPAFKAALPPVDPPPQLQSRVAEYWRDPVANGALLPSPYDAPVRCGRFVRTDGNAASDGTREVPFFEDRDGGFDLYRRLHDQGPTRYDQLTRGLHPRQQRLLKQLLLANLVEAPAPAAVAAEAP